MKVLLMYEYPASPGGLAMQGELLYQGLLEMGVDVHPVHLESSMEKEWYYRWFQPDVAVGIGYWGYTPNLVVHPQQYGVLPVPWLVADGYIANYQDVLNDLPLILVTSQWVKEMYIRDGIDGGKIEVLPVGCNTDKFKPIPADHPEVKAVREALGIEPHELMILTAGGDACSKGAQEVMKALADIAPVLPPWKYVCKVWPQMRTYKQNELDMQLATQLGIEANVKYATSIISRNYMPYLLNACDIYAAPARIEGFGMLQVEAGACEKPVIGLNAMGMLDTLVHGKTALMAGVAEKITLSEVMLEDAASPGGHRLVQFASPRTVDYRASVEDIRDALEQLVFSKDYRHQLGVAARQHVIKHFNYRRVAEKFVQIMADRLSIR
ncbi:glycosyltransferase involved in cell wall biosynthesis [Chitinophaga dinghuensis]|uniref:Glycosyltransferase involved in cell wall biosynthesis n=1 Tax=Chitinophaga dinghuensis TaxID=1539050 RepID=A0A327VQ62_9BACT|nr:glycosyltransferase family 4 protein [Chitinophaga dinghuensis]RAJ76576.1 glycosyltransferase involved in cell wall biosynthesis [Chitinophaga dinghuensis]